MSDEEAAPAPDHAAAREDPPLGPAPAAHRRPGLVALLFAHRALASILVALPITATLGAVTAPYPRGQAELFDPGGLMLLESLRLSRPALPALAWSGAGFALVFAALGLLPLGMLIAGLGRVGPVSAAFLFRRAGKHFGSLALLFGVTLAAQLVTASLLALLGGKLIDALRLVPPAEDITFLALFAVIFGILSALGVVRDLAYVAAVHEGRGFYVAVTRALGAASRRPLGTFFAWAWRAALGALGLIAAASLAPAARDATTAAVMVAFAMHQAALMGVAFARGAWIARAMRSLMESAPRAE